MQLDHNGLGELWLVDTAQYYYRLNYSHTFEDLCHLLVGVGRQQLGWRGVGGDVMSPVTCLVQEHVCANGVPGCVSKCSALNGWHTSMASPC